MKKITFCFLMFFMTLCLIGCQKYIEGNKTIQIVSLDNISINETIQLEIEKNGKKDESIDNYLWTVSNPNIATIENGLLQALNYGKVIIKAIDKEDATIFAFKEIEVVHPTIKDIIITGKHLMYVGDQYNFIATVVPIEATNELTWVSTDEDVLFIDNGTAIAIGVGTTQILVTCDNFTRGFTVEVLAEPLSLEIEYKSNMVVNETQVLKFNIENVEVKSQNEDIIKVNGSTILALKEGSAILSIQSIDNPTISETIEITVKTYFKRLDSATPEEQLIIDEKLASMSLNQMIGQMFLMKYTCDSVNASTGLPIIPGGRNEAGMSTTTNLDEYLTNYPIGNFVLSSSASSDENLIFEGSKNIHDFILNKTGIGAYCAYDQNYFNSTLPIAFCSNMSLAATKNTNLVYQYSSLLGKELKGYGVNGVISPYLIGSGWDSINTFGDLDDNALYASALNQGFVDEGLIFSSSLDNDSSIFPMFDFDFCDKQIRSNVLLNSPILYIGRAYDNDGHPLITSSEFIQDYIRDTARYDDVICLDPNSFQILGINYEYNFEQLVIDAILAGVDMIGVTFQFRNWGSYLNRFILSAFDSLVYAVQSGTISMDRIKESVSRILLMKIRAGIIDGTECKKDNNQTNLIQYNEICKNIEKESLTVLGDFKGIDKNKSTIFVSLAYEDAPRVDKTFGDSFSSYFSDLGYSKFSVYRADRANLNQFFASVETCGQIIISIPNLHYQSRIGMGNEYQDYLTFVNTVLEIRPDTVVISVENPYDIEYIINAKNFICLYGNYSNNYEVILDYLNNGWSAKNTLPFKRG